MNYIPLLLHYKNQLNVMNLAAKPTNLQKAADILKNSDELYTAFSIPQFIIKCNIKNHAHDAVFGISAAEKSGKKTFIFIDTRF